MELVFMSLPLAAEEEDLRALLERHGVPWSKLQPILQSWHSADPDGRGFAELELQLSRKIDKLIVANVADKARLYSDLRSYNQPAPKKEIELTNLVRNGDTATGVMTYRQVLTATVTSGARAPYKIEHEATGSEGPITFRRVDGLWYFGLDNESVARHQKWINSDQALQKKDRD